MKAKLLAVALVLVSAAVACAQIGLPYQDPSWVFAPGDRVQVQAGAKYAGQLGTVTAVNYLGYTNSEPPVPFGELDTVQLDSGRTWSYLPSQLVEVP